MSLNCRFYEKEFPKVDDVVMVKVVNINEMGVHVKLLEYDNLDGYVSVSALSRKRIKSMSKIVKVGKQMALIVIRIDQNKGYIDLSKRDISEQEVSFCEGKYQKAKSLHNLVKSALISSRNKEEKWNDVSLEECCKKTIWTLYKPTHNNNPDEVLKKILSSEYKVFDELEENLFKQELLNVFQKKYKDVNPLIDAYVQIVCFSDDAVEDIKKSIELCFGSKKKDSDLEITIVSPPTFKLHLKSCQGSSEALQEMVHVLDYLREEIEKRSGSMKIIKEPHIRNESDLFVYEEPEQDDDSDLDIDNDIEEL